MYLRAMFLLRESPSDSSYSNLSCQVHNWLVNFKFVGSLVLTCGQSESSLLNVQPPTQFRLRIPKHLRPSEFCHTRCTHPSDSESLPRLSSRSLLLPPSYLIPSGMFVFGPPKLTRSIDLFAANLLVIRVTRLPHVTTLPGPAATMGRSAAWFPSLLG